MADEFIQQGKADIINLGRQLICDPETPNKYFSGRKLEIKRCFACIAACGSGACVYDPYTGPFQKDLIPTDTPKKIIVLGGDEYLSSPIDLRPKFHLYKANIALISGIAWDHINAFPTYENYVGQFSTFLDTMVKGGTIIYNDNLVIWIIQVK